MKIGLIIKTIIIACMSILAGMALLIFYAFQPDRGGTHGCADLTGITPEKYGAKFIPEGILPTFSYARYKYSLNACAFDKLKKKYN